MHPFLLLVFLALSADASRSHAHARRAFALQHRDPLLGLGDSGGGILGGLTSDLLGGGSSSTPSATPPASSPKSNTPSASTTCDSCSSQSTSPHATSPTPTSQQPAPSSSTPHPTTQAPQSPTTTQPPQTQTKAAQSSAQSGCGLLGDVACPSSTPLLPPQIAGSSSPLSLPTSPLLCDLRNGVTGSCSSSTLPQPPPQTTGPSSTPTSPLLCDLGNGALCSSSTPPPPPQTTGTSNPPPLPTVSSTPSCGVLEGLTGCPSSSTTPTDTGSQSSTAFQTTTQNTFTPTPTTSCSLLGLFGCTTATPTLTTTGLTTSSTPSSTVTTFSSISTTSSTPSSTVTTFSSISTTSSTLSSTVISFSSISTTSTQSFTSGSASSTYSSTRSHLSVLSNSNYDYLTATTLLLATPSPTTQTGSNPDQAATTLSLLSQAPTASPTTAPLPSGLPRVILPQPPINLSSIPSSDVMINILFNASLNWEFVAENADSQGQIFEYFPLVIASALNINASEVRNYDMLVQIPSSYTGPQDVALLETVWQGYIPSDLVSTLASLIADLKSSFYTGQVAPIPAQLAACVDPSLQLNAIQGPKPGGSATATSSSGSSVRQDAIIGVVSSLGAIAIMIVAYVGLKAYKRRRAAAHTRLSDDNPQNVGMRPDGQDFDRDSVGGQRRRSFYYAEDSLRGFQSTHPDEDGYDHHVTNMRERRAIQPGTISTPILRESTMNW